MHPGATRSGLAVAWLLAFLIPSGQYNRNDSGAPIRGVCYRVDPGQSFVDRLILFLMTWARTVSA
nr:hypothetical protein OG999_39915 [Streptomyces sp. NBC_00886]